MGKFVYKYNTIKKVKEMMEKKTQKEIASIDLEIAAVEEEINRLKHEIHTNILNLKDTRMNVSEIKNQRDYTKYLEDQIIVKEKEIIKLEDQKEFKMQELIEKSKEVKIFNTLEEIHLENYKEEEKKKENINIDEIASQKFSRGKQ